MEEILAILKDPSNVGYLATVDQGKPRVRLWGFMFEEEGRLYFCTSSVKDVYQQLINTPYIEYSKTTREMVWIRISGAIKFDEDPRKKSEML
ncbi:MAG TPA: pyridoxamine 5'-phosphate oxidase family protein [Bacillota bacterium]|nr:pyridoxamine 5'-phosphate oxidase family protein [Bacillota bacterium]